jgi:hypothetical protein
VILEYMALYRLYIAVPSPMCSIHDDLEITWWTMGVSGWMMRRQTSLMTEHSPHPMQVQLLFGRLSRSPLPQQLQETMAPLGSVLERQCFGFVNVRDRWVYILGGQDRNVKTASVLRVDLRTRVIEELPPLHRPLIVTEMPVLVGMPGCIVVMEECGTTSVLDLETHTWSLRTGRPLDAAPPNSIACGCRLDDRTVLAVTRRGIALCYSLHTAAWSRMQASLPRGLIDVHSCVAVWDHGPIFLYGWNAGRRACAVFKASKGVWRLQDPEKYCPPPPACRPAQRLVFAAYTW